MHRLIRNQFIDAAITLAPLVRGPHDPTSRLSAKEFHRAIRTTSGPASIRISWASGDIEVEAWGPGSAEALEISESLVGLHDLIEDFDPKGGLIGTLNRRYRGLRMTSGTSAMEALVPTIIEQRVNGKSARLSFVRLVKRFGERAPGPLALWLQPSSETLASLPYWVFHPMGIERGRAQTITNVAERADSLARFQGADGHKFRAALEALPGIGPWSSAEVSRIVLGDPDAVSIGDFHLPNLVSWALAGEARGDDTRMLELLEPYKGHRARVARLLEVGHRAAPKFGPRRPVVDIEAI